MNPSTNQRSAETNPDKVMEEQFILKALDRIDREQRNSRLILFLFIIGAGAAIVWLVYPQFAATPANPQADLILRSVILLTVVMGLISTKLQHDMTRNTNRILRALDEISNTIG